MDYFTADQHFNHANIISLCNRPWATKREMNEALIQLWNSRVAPQDRVFVLGDFALATSKEITEFAAALNGRKILIMGNHDNHRVKTYLSCGFDEVRPQRTQVEYGRFFTMSHEPLRMVESGKVNIHGHIHNKPLDSPNHICVSVENTNYMPVTLEEIIAMYKERNSGRQ